MFDARGVLIAKGVREVGVSEPQPDRVEQDPEALVVSVNEAIAGAVASLGNRRRRIAAAGLATQRSSIACWDRATGEALSPVISWQDRRAHAWLSLFSARREAATAPDLVAGRTSGASRDTGSAHGPRLGPIGEAATGASLHRGPRLGTIGEDIHRRTGLMLSAHYGASKLRWCLDHLPAVAKARAAGRLSMGPLASFLLFRLLEERPLLADPANASRTLLWNLKMRDWDAELLALFGIPRDVLPRCVPTHHAFGTLRVDELAIPLVLATGDQSAALFADGEPRADTIYINLGTGAFVQRLAGRDAAYPPRLLASVVCQEKEEVTFVLEGTVNGAGAALSWIARQLGVADLERRLPEWLSRETALPLFLNGIGGLGAPFWVADFSSRFAGESATRPSLACGPRLDPIGEAEPWQQAAAVAESIVFLLQENIDEMKSFAAPAQRILATGGLAVLDGLCQRIADLSGLPVRRATEREATARGTAYLLAGRPTEWAQPDGGTRFDPRPNAALADRYRRWGAAMRAAIG